MLSALRVYLPPLKRAIADDNISCQLSSKMDKTALVNHVIGGSHSIVSACFPIVCIEHKIFSVKIRGKSRNDTHLLTEATLLPEADHHNVIADKTPKEIRCTYSLRIARRR